MTEVRITLSDETGAFIRGLVDTGAFASVEEYVRSLVEADRRREAAESARVEALLLESVEKNEYRPVDDDFWEDLRKRSAARHPPRASA